MGPGEIRIQSSERRCFLSVSNNLPVNSSGEQVASVRRKKHRFHVGRARFWTIVFIVARALYAIIMSVAGLTLFASVALFIEALFGKAPQFPTIRVLQMLLGSFIWFRWLVPFSLWMISNVRDIRNAHLRLASGYAQRSAEEILYARGDGGSFGLFLRGFDFEAQSRTYSGLNPELGSEEAQIYARPVEALLVEMLSEEVPLVALPDPREPEPLPGIFRFENVLTNWVEFINGLLPDAFPIIVHLTSLTPGIKLEISILKSSGHSKKVLVIVSRNLVTESGLADEQHLEALDGFNHIVFEQRHEIWSREEEIQFHSRLRECLRALERENQDKPPLIRAPAANIRAITPTLGASLLHFLKGTALSAYILSVSMITLYFIISLLVRDGLPLSLNLFLSIVTSTIWAWPVFFIVLTATKAIAYVLGYTTAPGDNPNFKGFSGILRQVKKYGRTPK